VTIVLAHGFTQTARSWDRFRELLQHATGEQIDAVDLPGHGTASARRSDLWASADHLVDAGGIGTYVGYSMGGRVCLHAALARPETVQRLVLIGATAGIEDDDMRIARRADDDELADEIERIGVESFVDRWLTNPLFDGLTEETAQRSDRLRNTASGLASSLRLAGTGTQQPLWSRLGEIGQPTLLIVGERDMKFRAVADRMASALPNADTTVIAEAGHSVHLEQPEATVAALTAWLRAD
jgi:2-succinyl-6-hydroxy-2,4-cyclohexadiene-1-carboxylate synthase